MVTSCVAGMQPIRDGLLLIKGIFWYEKIFFNFSIQTMVKTLRMGNYSLLFSYLSDKHFKENKFYHVWKVDSE
jgi:hypothetical protein